MTVPPMATPAGQHRHDRPQLEVVLPGRLEPAPSARLSFCSTPLYIW